MTFKGLPRSFSVMFMNIYMYKPKWQVLLGRLMVLIILLYEQLMHDTGTDKYMPKPSG